MGEFMTRADFVRVKRMDEAAEQAKEVRKAKEQNKAFLSQQKERFRKRGVILREERFQTEEKIADAIEECRQQAHAIGDTFRKRQEKLRGQRSDFEREYVSHGRALTEKYSTRDNQERVRDLKAEICDEKTRVATEMKAQLKRLKEEVDDTIKSENTDRCRRVYQDTCHDVIRFSKHQIVANRWDRADYVRDTVSVWKAEAKAREEEYVERARRIRNEESLSKDEIERAAAMRHEERLAIARHQAEMRRQIKAERELVTESVLEQNRIAHDAIEESFLIPAAQVAKAVTGGEETLRKLSRFFDFRRMAWSTAPDSMSPRRMPIRL